MTRAPGRRRIDQARHRRGLRPSMRVFLGALAAFTVLELSAAMAAMERPSLPQGASAAAAGQATPGSRAGNADLPDLASGANLRPHGPGPRLPTREAQGTAPRRTAGRTPAQPPVIGVASTYGPGWDGWIAWPGGPGWRLRVCGPGGCVVVVTTDAGPDLAMQRVGRVVDLDVATFERVAGAPWTVGLTRVTLTVLGRTPESSA